MLLSKKDYLRLCFFIYDLYDDSFEIMILNTLNINSHTYYSYILKRKVELNTVCDIELATFFYDIINQYVDCLISMEI